MIKAMMAEKFKNILLPAAEDVMPASTYRRYDDDDDIVHAHDKSTQTKRFADAGTTTLADDLGSSNESYIKEFPPLSSTLSM